MTVTVPVTGITVSPATLSLTTGQTGQVNATITPANATNKSISWSSSNTSVATVSITGLVTSVSPGTANITVTSSDGGFTSTCAVTVTAPVVPVTGVSVSPATLSLEKGKTGTLTATVAPANATNKNVSWSSSNSAVATVNTTGVVTAVGGGLATITVTTADGNKTATSSITVTVPVSGVTLSPATLSIVEGNEANTTFTVAPADATNKNVTWSSSNTAVATVGATGVVVGRAVGSATITVTTVDGGKTATCVVTVTAAAVPVTGISLTPATLTLIPGGTGVIAATVSPANATNKKVTWTSSNTNVATVNEKGEVSALTPGHAKISVFTQDGNFEAVCSVTVLAPVTGVTLNHTTYTIEEGNAFQLTATVEPANATNKNVTWSSSDEGAVTVGATGLVNAMEPGSVVITVTTVDGGYTATCTVTVTEKIIPVTGVEVDSRLILTIGNTKTLEAKVLPTNATDKRITWSSSNTSVASVNEKGEVSGVSAGSAIVTVTTFDGGHTATCNVNVDPIFVTGVTVSPTSLALNPGESVQLSATITPKDATNPNVIWSSSNSRNVSVNQNGLVNMAARSSGGATITVTTEDGDYIAICEVSLYVSVTGITLDKDVHYMPSNTTSITAPVTATVLPSSASDQSITWSSSNGLIATVSATGNITSRLTGTCTITATTNDGGFTASYTLYVGTRVTGVTLNKASTYLYAPIYADASNPSSEQLIATIEPANAVNKNVTWSSSNPAIATVDQKGVVTVITTEHHKQCTITVTTQDGSKTASCVVHVNVIN